MRVYTNYLFIVSGISLWLIASASAQTSLSYNFEDGQVRGNPTSMRVPPRVLEEDGNHFLRITGSRGDCQALPGDLCPPRNRSTVVFTDHYSSMPLISDANMRQTYSAKMRFHDNTGTDGVVLELFQSAPGGESEYATKNGTGPVVICWRNGSLLSCRANYANNTKWDLVPMGASPAGTWHTIRVDAVWSHDPSQGSIAISLDGTVRKKITGRDVNVGPATNRLPNMKLGLYGDHAVGQIDVDDVQAGAGSPGDPTPPPVVQLLPPTNLRVVVQ